MSALSALRRLLGRRTALVLTLAVTATFVAAAPASADMGTQVSAASAYASSRGTQVGITVVDRDTHAVYTNGLAHTQLRSASIPKLFVAESLLRRSRAGTITLSAKDRALLVIMIERSDDSAMSSLYTRLGGLAMVHEVWRRYGLTELGDPPTPGFWGMFKITSYDIVKFYYGMMNGGLAAADRDYLISLMRHATATGTDGFYQYFGIPSALPNQTWGIKQGWMCCMLNTRWLHTTGILGADNRFLVAVLSRSPLSRSDAYVGRTLTGVVQRLFPGGGVPSSVALRNPVGALQRLTEVTPGTVRAEGWSFDPDAPTQPDRVHIYVRGAYAGAGTADIVRTDVATRYPQAGPAHGYRIDVRVPDGTSEVCAYAINIGRGTTNPLLGCQDVTVRLSPIGKLDSATVVGARTVHTTGWTLDREAPTVPLRLHVYVDGHWATAVTADVNRPDVDAANPGAGALHGWSADAVIASGGQHQVCAYAINAPGTQGGNPQLGCATVSLPTTVRGALTAVTPETPGQFQVSGWAVDPNVRTSAVRVHVYVDGRMITGTTADQPWADYASVMPDAGPQHGYAVTVGLSAGTHQVCTYGISLTGTGNPQLGCQSVTG